MQRIILHIGSDKTGSTALQRFWNLNKEEMSKKGVLYYHPKYRYLPWRKGTNADVFLYLIYEKMGIELEPELANRISEETVRLQSQSSDYNVLLFSEETLWIHSFKYENFWFCLKNVINSLFGKDTEISIILYLRRQDEWIYSYWKQLTRPVTTREKRQFRPFLDAFVKSGEMDYALGVSRIEEAFGMNHLTIRRYDPEHFLGGNIFYDFMRSLDFPISDLYQFPQGLINKSITVAAAEAVAFIGANKTLSIQIEDELIFPAAAMFSDMYPEKEILYPIHISEREEIIARYREGNAYIGEHYFDGKPLFSDSIKPYSVFEYDEARAEANAKTIIKLASLPLEKKAMIMRSLLKNRSGI